jgi:NADP-dependent 3-hydroxy acid dehydrogenase YdfG
MRLDGKIVVVTGAASGIGAALSRLALHAGARVIMADVNTQALEALRVELGADDERMRCFVVDVADVSQVQGLAADAQGCWGPVDVVVNNAGVGLAAAVESMSLADAHWLMNINFWGVVHGCRAFLPQLRTRPEAYLVNISSIFAMVSMPSQSMYNAAKAAVRGFTDSLREELAGSHVGLLCVHPGGVRTNIVVNSRLPDVAMLGTDRDTVIADFEAHAGTSPESAAAQIFAAMAHRRTRLLIGADARVLDLLFRINPARSSHWFTAILQWWRRRSDRQV